MFRKSIDLRNMATGIRLETLRELIATGTLREAVLVAQGRKWSAFVRTGMAERPLVTDRGHVREFGKLETAVGLLRGAGLGRISLEIANFDRAPSQRSLSGAKNRLNVLADGYRRHTSHGER